MSSRRPNRLRELRKARGLSQERLAFRAGVTSATIARLERGENTPSLATAQDIAGALGVGVAEVWPVLEPEEAVS